MLFDFITCVFPHPDVINVNLMTAEKDQMRFSCVSLHFKRGKIHHFTLQIILGDFVNRKFERGGVY